MLLHRLWIFLIVHQNLLQGGNWRAILGLVGHLTQRRHEGIQRILTMTVEIYTQRNPPRPCT